MPRTVQRKKRSPTPPPIWDPVVEEDDDLRWEWYYGLDGGGMILPFKQYEKESRPMHSVGLPYLLYCHEKSPRKGFLRAFEKYHTGLQELVEVDYQYEDFRIPFGAKHRGVRLRECRDKPWLLWCSDRQYLTKKHPLFFRAVQRWLDNPQKIEHTRDVGELLSASKYTDDLNLHEDELDDASYSCASDEGAAQNETDTGSDLEGFVVPDSEPLQYETAEEEEEEDAIRHRRTPRKQRNRRKESQLSDRKKKVKSKRRRVESDISDKESDGAASYIPSDSDADSLPNALEQTRSRTLRRQQETNQADLPTCYMCSSDDESDDVPIIGGLCDTCHASLPARKKNMHDSGPAQESKEGDTAKKGRALRLAHHLEAHPPSRRPAHKRPRRDDEEDSEHLQEHKKRRDMAPAASSTLARPVRISQKMKGKTRAS